MEDEYDDKSLLRTSSPTITTTSSHHKDGEAAIIETTSTDSMETNATNTNRSILSRMNEKIVETQVSLHEKVSDWGVRTENILALFWGGFVFFVGLAFNIAQSNTSLMDDRFATIYWVIFSFMVIGIFFMAVAIHHRDNENVYIHIDEEVELVGDQTKMLHYLLRSVFVLGLGMNLMDFLSLVTVFHCGFGRGDVNGTKENQYASILLYHIARFIFTSLQLVLLQILTSSRIRRSGYYQFCIKLLCVHVIVTNISIWMTKLNQETGLFGNNNASGEYDALNCTLDSSDTFFPTAKHMDSRLQPFILQFCLLSSALFYILYPFLKETQKVAQSSRGYGGYQYKAVNIIKDATRQYRTFPSLLVGTTIALLLIVASWNVQDASQHIHNLRFNYLVQLFTCLLIAVLARIVLFQMKEYHRTVHQDQVYKIEDILLILSGPLGYLPYCLLVLFASFAIGEKEQDGHPFLKANQTEMRTWSAFWAAANILSVFIQTHFLIVGRHFRRDVVEERTRRGSGDVNDDVLYNNRLMSASKISQALIIIIFSNFGIWFLESFFETSSPFLVAQVYWGQHPWLVIDKLLYPFLIFFRLHSVTILSFMWIKFDIK